MASYNRVMLMGNLTHNPEIRYTPSGTAVADLRMAMNESYKNKAGETVESTCYVDVVVWGRQAETSSEYLHKGSPVFVEGRLQLDQWENQQGEKRSKLRVRADRVQSMGSPGQKGTEFSSTPGQPTSEQVAAEPPPDMADDDDVPF
ncbi:MAG: single-stranded DNA-binding protein [Kiritimatiellales bacterium]|nr:single-stranded DNA-binding protein [Kiritimatiellales bacterium]